MVNLSTCAIDVTSLMYHLLYTKASNKPTNKMGAVRMERSSFFSYFSIFCCRKYELLRWGMWKITFSVPSLAVRIYNFFGGVFGTRSKSWARGLNGHQLYRSLGAAWNFKVINQDCKERLSLLVFIQLRTLSGIVKFRSFHIPGPVRPCLHSENRTWELSGPMVEYLLIIQNTRALSSACL